MSDFDDGGSGTVIHPVVRPSGHGPAGRGGGLTTPRGAFWPGSTGKVIQIMGDTYIAKWNKNIEYTFQNVIH